MKPPGLVIAALAGLALVTPVLGSGRLAAQTAGSVELGAFGQFTRTDPAWHVDNGIGAGGRLAYFFNRRWSLEGGASLSSFTNQSPRATPGSSSQQTFDAQLVYNLPFGFGGTGARHSLLLEAGVGGERFSGHNDFAVPLGGGFRFMFNDDVGLRLDGLVGYVENPTATTFDFPPDAPGVNKEAARSTNIMLRAGVSFVLGRKAPPAAPPPQPVVAAAPQPAPVQPQAPTPTPPPREPNRDSIAAVDRAREALVAKLYFDFDKSDLREDQRAVLDAKVPVLRANPGVRIRIEGNADERGSDEYNMALGMRRAEMAKRYLIDHGIDASRIDISSNGEERPVCQQHDESCWSQNRRDEFVIVTGGDNLVPPG
jgi:peptidoglycan-associated lipoprotein